MRVLVCGGLSFYPHVRPGAGGVPTPSSGLRVQRRQCATLSPQLLLLERRRPPAVRRPRLRAAPLPGACPPESSRCRPVVAARRASQWRRGAWPRNLFNPTRSCARRSYSVKAVGRSKHELEQLFQLQLWESPHVLTGEPRGWRGVPSQRATTSTPRSSAFVCGCYSHPVFVRIPSLA